MIVNDITELIGKTPLLRIDPAIHRLTNVNLYCKLELLNPFGSVKDRGAWNMLKDELSGIKEASQSVIESSSGNMAKALQSICARHAIPFRAVTSRIKVKEIKYILQLLGAEIDELPGLSNCPDPTDPNNPAAFIDRAISSNPGRYFHTSQYTNVNNAGAHYCDTGPEIFDDLGAVDFLFGALGTTGSTLGAGQFLREKNPSLKVIGAVARKGESIPGIRNGDELHEVGLFKKDFYDEIRQVSTAETLDAMLTLIRQQGVLGGPTTGAVYAGALKYLSACEFSRPQTAVFMACDRVEWYLSYIRKWRPELFGFAPKPDSLRAFLMGRSTDLETVPELSPEQANGWLNSEQPPLIIDTRGSLAFKASQIPGSINLPDDILEELAEWGIPFARGSRILFVCPSGIQSCMYAAYFSSKGFNCSSIKGGFIAWCTVGLPVQGQFAAGYADNNVLVNTSA